MSTPNTLALIVEGQMPSAPLILLDGGVVASVTRLADAAKTVTITDAQQANVAGAFLTEASGLAKDIEKARKQVKQPFLDMGTKIDDAAKRETGKLDLAIRNLKDKLAAWQAEQDRLARLEAERLRKEQERLAEEQRKAEKALADAQEAARVAALAAQASDDDDLGSLGADLAVEAAQEAQQAFAQQAVVVAQAPRVVPMAAPAGIHYRTTLKHVVTDVAKLPAALTITTANDAEIRRLYCQGHKEGDPIPVVPGVTFTVSKEPVVNGRR